MKTLKPTREINWICGAFIPLKSCAVCLRFKDQTKPDFPPLDTRFPSFLRLVGEAREVWLISQTALPSVA